MLNKAMVSTALVLALVFNPSWVPALSAAQSSVIPQGTVIRLVLNHDLSTASMEQGDKFTATVTEDVVRNGLVLIRQGAVVNGTVAEVHRSKRLAGLQGKASMTLRFDSVNTVSGRKPIAATLVSVHDPAPGSTTASGSDKAAETKVGDEGEVTAKTDTTDILKKGAIGVAAGAVLGALFGTVSRGVLLGSIGGAVAILAPKGKDVKLDKGTGFQIRLDHDVTLSTT